MRTLPFAMGLLVTSGIGAHAYEVNQPSKVVAMMQ